tara:strand:+ start:85578 stop:85976 length:399 start_codon:yes stop_codon:yes gene_type:complete
MNALEKLAAKRRIASLLGQELFEETGKEAGLKEIGKALKGLMSKAKKTGKKVIEKGKKEVDVIRAKPQERLRAKWNKGPFVKKKVQNSRQANLAKADKRTKKSRTRAAVAAGGGLAGLSALGIATKGNSSPE